MIAGVSEASLAGDFSSAVAQRLKCDLDHAHAIIRAVMCTLRDGLSAEEADTIVLAMPPGIAAFWPPDVRDSPSIAELGGEGFLGRVRSLASLADDREAAAGVHAVFNELIGALGLPTNSRTATWAALANLPPAQKKLWMRLFRAANFPVELLATSH